MKRWKLFLPLTALVIGLIVPLFAAVAPAAADVNDFTITSFDADETLTKNDPQGELHVIEHISVLFNDQNHGLLRAIPAQYKHHKLQLKVNAVSSDTQASAKYTTYSQNGNTVLKIGDATKTVTGAHEYTIDYTLHNVISFYKDHDELYWDVNGDQWDQIDQKASVTVHLPADLQQHNQPICYAGTYGASDTSGCSVTLTGSTLHAETTRPLAPRQTLTYVDGYKPGYFTAYGTFDTLLENLKPVLEFAASLVLFIGASVVYWWTRGRDAKGTGVIIPQYSPPEGMTPLTAGTLADFKVDNKDITATIIDLAVRKYIKIIETKKNVPILKDKTEYSLAVTNADLSALTSYEAQIMHALFTQELAVGSLVNVSERANALSGTATKLRKYVTKDMTKQGYFKTNPVTAGEPLVIAASLVFAVVVLLGGFKLAGPFVGSGLLVGSVFAYLISRFVAARTALGVKAFEDLKGLKLYIEVAEKDRIAKLQSPDAPYAAASDEPVKTVELFEKLLPYAMIFGVEKQWAGKFEDLYTTPPDWYSGNFSTFNAFYLASSLQDGVGSAVSTAFTAPTSSGSSGFGGGGFSGGGGGGGGGGGW